MVTQTYKGFKNADFNVKLESADSDDLYMHCEVHNWNPKSLRGMYKVFAEISLEASDIGFKRLCTITPNPKFAMLFGFNEVGSLTYGDKEYKVMTWELN